MKGHREKPSSATLDACQLPLSSFQFTWAPANPSTREHEDLSSPALAQSSVATNVQQTTLQDCNFERIPRGPAPCTAPTVGGRPSPIPMQSSVPAGPRQVSLYRFRFTRTERGRSAARAAGIGAKARGGTLGNGNTVKRHFERPVQAYHRLHQEGLEARRQLHAATGARLGRLEGAIRKTTRRMHATQLASQRHLLQERGVFRPEAEVAADAEAEPPLCEEQQKLLDIIASGRNVFYTGPAGCGKSAVLRAAVKMLSASGKAVYVIAPTGHAALLAHGMTMWSYMGWTPKTMEKPLTEVALASLRPKASQRIRETQVLIIEEISMISSLKLQALDLCMKVVRNQRELKEGRPCPPFGGVQIIVTGDFCQLPPVKPFERCIKCGDETKYNQNKCRYYCQKGHGSHSDYEKWAFTSGAWKEANFVHVHLRQIHRQQQDRQFIGILQKCRLGIRLSDSEMQCLRADNGNLEGATRILCTLAEVALANDKEYSIMDTDQCFYAAVDGFRSSSDAAAGAARDGDRAGAAAAPERNEVEMLDKNLKLRVDMLVILKVNLDKRAGLVNGSQGVICGFEEFDDDDLPKVRSAHAKHAEPHMVITGEHAKLKAAQIKRFMGSHRASPDEEARRGWPRVRFHNGITRTIYAHCIVNHDDRGGGGGAIGANAGLCYRYRTQIPLVAGWAISVHRSQGMTIDRVIVDVSKCFAAGQVYVALSRATSLSRLKIEGGLDRVQECSVDRTVREFLRKAFGD